MGRSRITQLLLAATAAVAVLTAGCGTDGDEVSVSAAASLTEAFTDLAEAFEVRQPDIDVVLNIGASSALREQVVEGAPTDVLAVASDDVITGLVERGLLIETAPFATNTLAIATPTGNPGGIAGLDDFARESLVLGLCAVGVPCGDYARDVLAAAGIEPVVDTNEPSVRALLTKIEAGELDGGIVYRTDIAASVGAVDVVEIPAAANATVSYPIGVVADGPNPVAAMAFVEFVHSAEGREILGRHGFGAP